MTPINKSQDTVAAGVDHLTTTFQRVFGMSTPPDDPYDHIVWHVIQSGETVFETSRYRLPFGTNAKPRHEMARRVIQYEMEQIAAVDTSSAGANTVPMRKQPAGRVMSGLFMSRMGAALDDSEQRRRATERLALWVTGQGKLENLVHSLYTALEHSDYGVSGSLWNGMQESWKISQQVLHAAHHTFATAQDTAFSWQQPLLLDTMVEHCANAASMNMQHHHSGIVLRQAEIPEEYW